MPCLPTRPAPLPLARLSQELLHKTGLGGKAADVYWFDAGNNTFWAPKETLIAISFLLFAWAECNRAQVGAGPVTGAIPPPLLGASRACRIPRCALSSHVAPLTAAARPSFCSLPPPAPAGLLQARLQRV